MWFSYLFTAVIDFYATFKTSKYMSTNMNYTIRNKVMRTYQGKKGLSVIIFGPSFCSSKKELLPFGSTDQCKGNKLHPRTLCILPSIQKSILLVSYI